MEEQDDDMGTAKEIGFSCSSSWEEVDGCLPESVKVVEESDDAIYTAEPTSLLILAPPGRGGEQEGEKDMQKEGKPCELKVTFQRRCGQVHQVYVLSSARICEIYGQRELGGDQEYVCTVRGGIISLTDDDLSDDDNASEISHPVSTQENSTFGDCVSNIRSAFPAENERPPSPAETLQFSASEELPAAGEGESLGPVHFVPYARKLPDEILFPGFTEAVSAKNANGLAACEESLDPVDWVECPTSPLKSVCSTVDDEAEVGVTKSGFYLVDADTESQNSQHSQQVRLFTDAIRTSGQDSSSISLEAVVTETSNHFSWAEADPPFKTCLYNGPLCQVATAKMPGKEQSDSPVAEDAQFKDGEAGEDVPETEFFVFEGNADGVCISPTLAPRTPGNTSANTPVVSPEVSNSNESEGRGESENDADVDTWSRFEPPVYECELSLENSDPWTSVTIRLLSMKNRDRVRIHRVVVTYTPGPPIFLSAKGARVPLQSGVGSSSLLAMLVPGILQMARGLSEPSRKKNSVQSSSSAEKKRGEEKGTSSEVVTHTAPLQSQVITANGDSTPAFKKAGLDDHATVTENDLSAGTEAQSGSHLEDGFLSGVSTMEKVVKSAEAVSMSASDGKTGSVVPPVEEPELVPAKESRDIKETEKNTSGVSFTSQKDDRFGELVQRMDRLETICLRMESSLNLALDNMDSRLKVLESGGFGSGFGRMPPPLGHPIWGTGFESGSFASAASVHLPTEQTAASGAASAMDLQDILVSGPPEAAHVQEGEASAQHDPPSDKPCYTCLLSSAPPSVIPASLPSGLPFWPLSSWPQNVLPNLGSRSSGLTGSCISKSGVLNQSNPSVRDDSELPSNGETYWESRTSEDDSETDFSSDSEQTSYADNREACECFSESLSPSSPVKPGQLVDNALASALSAFSASFETQHDEFCREDEDDEDEVSQAEEGEGEVDGEVEGESDDLEDSFTSEEQVPLVELDFFSSYFAKEVVRNADAEKASLHGYEAIPLSVIDKDTSDVTTKKVRLPPQNLHFSWQREDREYGQVTSWPDERLQSHVKIFRALEEFVNQTEGQTIASESPPPAFPRKSDECCVDDPTDDLGGVNPDPIISIEEKLEDKNVRAVSEAEELDVSRNFLQNLVAAGGDENVDGDMSAWLEQGWTGSEEDVEEITKDAVSSYLTVRGLSKPLDSKEEMFRQGGVFPLGGLFPAGWKTFTSEAPFHSLVEVRDLLEDNDATESGPFPRLVETSIVLEEKSSKIAPVQAEPWSLLDDDASIPKPTQQQQIQEDMQGIAQNSQWSLIDEYPPQLSGDKESLAEECNPGGAGDRVGLGLKEMRSLLDEDISIPPGDEIPPTVEGDGKADHVPSPPPAAASLEETFTMSGGIQFASSPASKSNPFEGESLDGLDLSQDSVNSTPLVSMEDFVEQLEVGTAEADRPQSLVFHLTL